MNYIGVDCHISSLDFAVVNEKGTDPAMKWWTLG
jgi:hypothetical protein